MDYKMQFAESLSNIFTNELTQKQILDLIETPKQDEFGDAFPCFSLAKQYKKHQLLSQRKLLRNSMIRFYESRSRWSLCKCIFQS